VLTFRWLLAKYKFKKTSIKLGYSVPINVFGPGLSIPHYGTIVVNPNVKVGANCRLHVGVNIGASGGADQVPTIGDNVYIGPGAIIFGNITIGNNVSIGANSTVTKSFGDNVVIAGSPAKIIKSNEDNGNS
jgi:serine O-acetyltransferase